ncbi:MAG TPA: hypothetical protein VIJ18_01790 [Microbacteriaceae bacterium]
MTLPEEHAVPAGGAKAGAARMSATPILARALRDGGIFALVVAVVAGAIGMLTAGLPGLYGGLLGAATAAAFLGLTAGSMLVAGRVTKGDQTTPVFFGIVMGTWVLKLVLFIVLLLWLGRQNWLDGPVFFFAVIAAVIGSLVIDCVAFIRGRVPYVSDVTLPHQGGSSS